MVSAVFGHFRFNNAIKGYPRREAFSYYLLDVCESKFIMRLAWSVITSTS